MLLVQQKKPTSRCGLATIRKKKSKVCQQTYFRSGLPTSVFNKKNYVTFSKLWTNYMTFLLLEFGYEQMSTDVYPGGSLQYDIGESWSPW